MRIFSDQPYFEKDHHNYRTKGVEHAFKKSDDLTQIGATYGFASFGVDRRLIDGFETSILYSCNFCKTSKTKKLTRVFLNVFIALKFMLLFKYVVTKH